MSLCFCVRVNIVHDFTLYRGYYIRAAAVSHCVVTFFKTFADCRTQVSLALIDYH